MSCEGGDKLFKSFKKNYNLFFFISRRCRVLVVLVRAGHVRISERLHGNKNDDIALKTKQDNHPNILPQLPAAQTSTLPPPIKCVQ